MNEELLNERLNKLMEDGKPIYLRDDLKYYSEYGDLLLIDGMDIGISIESWDKGYSDFPRKLQGIRKLGTYHIYTQEMIDWDKTLEYQKEEKEVVKEECINGISKDEYLSNTLETIFKITINQIEKMYHSHGFAFVSYGNGVSKFYDGTPNTYVFGSSDLTPEIVKGIAKSIADSFKNKLVQMSEMARPTKIVNDVTEIAEGDRIIINDKKYIFNGYDEDDVTTFSLMIIDCGKEIYIDDPYSAPTIKYLKCSPELIQQMIHMGVEVEYENPEWGIGDFQCIVNTIEEIRHLGNCEEMHKNIR